MDNANGKAQKNIINCNMTLQGTFCLSTAGGFIKH